MFYEQVYKPFKGIFQSLIFRWKMFDISNDTE